jgi:hypothetical protein
MPPFTGATSHPSRRTPTSTPMGIDYADLRRFDDSYLGEVSDLLSFWPRWITAKWRRREMTNYPE